MLAAGPSRVHTSRRQRGRRRSMRAIETFILVAAVTSTPVLGCTIDPSVSVDDTPIVNGQPDVGDPAVVMLSIQGDGGGWGCTGTLISPHVVLTAQHCVD